MQIFRQYEGDVEVGIMVFWDLEVVQYESRHAGPEVETRDLVPSQA